MRLIEILKKAGFRGGALRMAYAIAMAESGGNARAYNGRGLDRSYGLFQINMLGAMGPDRRRRYGLKSNSALFDPLTNARVAYRMSNGGRNWRPWSTYLNGAYRSHLGRADARIRNAGGSGGGGGGGGSVGSVRASLDRGELAESYGLTSRLINSSKELRRLFSQAVSNGWSPQKFQAKLRNTKWWKTQPDTLRQYLVQKYSDPATWNQKRRQAAYELNAMAVEVGMDRQKHGTKWSGLLRKAVYYRLAWGWSDERLKDWFGTHVKTHGGYMWGEAGEVFDQLHELAYLNGMRYKDWYKTASRAVVSGRSTIEREESKIRRDAAAKYGAFAEQIRAGQNAIDLAAPYIQSVATLLELPETDVDLFNTHVRKAMTGSQAGSSFPLWQFENMVRDDPRWKKTNNAREGIMTVAHQVAKDFGLAY